MSITSVTLQWDAPSGYTTVRALSATFSSQDSVPPPPGSNPVDTVQYKLQELEGWYTAPAQRTEITDYPQADGGAAPWRGYLSPRTISLTAWLIGPPAAVRDAWQTINSIALDGRQFIIDVVDDLTNLPLRATVFRVDTQAAVLREGAIRFQLNMTAPDPVKYGEWQTLTTIGTAVQSTGVNVPYKGTHISPAIIELTGPKSGTTAWDIGNDKGERVYFPSGQPAVATGEVVLISPDLGGQVFRDTNNVTHVVTGASRYPKLYPQAPGATTRFTLSAGSSSLTQLAVSWRDAYL